jgi:hypothetical protein
MGLPSINITFQSAAQTASKRGQEGVVVLIFKDASVASGLTEHIMTNVTEIPEALSATNKQYITDAFLGNPMTVRAVCIPSAAANYTTALDYIETIKCNIVTIPGISNGDVAAIVTWGKAVRDSKERKILTIVPNATTPDHEGIINFCTDGIKVGATTYTASQYSARLAGIIAGLPLTVAPTYSILSEVTDLTTKQTKAQAGADVDLGKIILYHDGEKVKIARGVTSLTTLTGKLASYKKIKIIRILDLIYLDIKKNIEDNYVGQVSNNYMNKLLLINAINSYLEGLENEGLLDNGKNLCEIDIAATRTYLTSIGVSANSLSDQQIKEYNTQDKVYLKATVVPLDAIEEITLVINL